MPDVTRKKKTGKNQCSMPLVLTLIPFGVIHHIKEGLHLKKQFQPPAKNINVETYIQLVTAEPD